LNDHLSEIDIQAKDIFFQLVEQMAEQECITKQLKAENQIEWVRRMNNVKSRAEEMT
jgi:nucleoside diphosphate kinase